MGTDAGEGLFQVDGLGDVIDRAGLEAFEFIFFIGTGGDEEDGYGGGVGVGFEASAGFDAVHLGHHDVEEYEVGFLLADYLDAFEPVGCDEDI